MRLALTSYKSYQINTSLLFAFRTVQVKSGQNDIIVVFEPFLIANGAKNYCDEN